MPVPRYHGLFNPTLQALRNLGGSASIAELEEEVSKILHLSDEEIADPHDERRTKLEYRLAWARTYLKAYGMLDNSERGVWALTPRGKELDVVDSKQIRRFVREQRESRKQQEYEDAGAVEYETVAIVEPDHRKLVTHEVPDLIRVEPEEKRSLTYLDAAETILRMVSQPLHYNEITTKALAQQLIRPEGLTPAATMGSRLYTDTQQPNSRFVRAGRGRFGLVQWRPSGIDAQVQKINQDTRAQLRQHLSTMPPQRFEALVSELLIQMGFDESTVKVTKYSGDGGIDVTGTIKAAGLTEISAAVQVKRWKSNIQAPAIAHLRGSLPVHQQGIIITTSDFSPGARQEAGALGKTRISLINGEELLDLLVKHKVGVVEQTLTVLGLDDEWWGELIGTSVEAPLEEIGRAGAIDVTALPMAVADGPTGHKPTGFTLLGESCPAASWREVIMGVSEALALRHDPGFVAPALALRGKKHQHIGQTPEGMKAPKRILRYRTVAGDEPERPLCTAPDRTSLESTWPAAGGICCDLRVTLSTARASVGRLSQDHGGCRWWNRWFDSRSTMGQHRCAKRGASHG